MPNVHTSKALAEVRKWMRRRACCPGDDKLAESITVLTADWLLWRRSGMDIVASGVRNEIEKIVGAIADL